MTTTPADHARTPTHSTPGRWLGTNWIIAAARWEDRYAVELAGTTISRRDFISQLIGEMTGPDEMPDRAKASNLINLLAFRGVVEPLVPNGRSTPTAFIVHDLLTEHEPVMVDEDGDPLGHKLTPSEVRAMRRLAGGKLTGPLKDALVALVDATVDERLEEVTAP